MKNQLIGILAAVALASNLSAQSVDTVTATNLSEPFGVVADGTGIIYITDAANNRIEKFNVTTGVKSTLAGSLQSGSANGTGSQARFFYPQGLIVARGGLIVTDSGNNTIRFVGFNGAVSNIAGQVGAYDFQDGTGSSAHFANPLGLAADTNGNIFVADSGNNAIRKLAPDNSVTTIITGLFEPAAVAVGDNGDLWVADTRRHVIKRYNSSGTLNLIVGLPGTSGTNDSDVASGARFSSPRGLLWLGGNTGLLISDSGNHTLRRLYPNPDNGDFNIETLAGTPGQAGFVNGAPNASKFNSPISLCRDPINGGFLVVDRANNAVRRLQTSAPLPPVSAPVIGTVSFPPPTFLSVLTPVSAAVFNNDVIIAVLPESGTETFFTFGPTPPSVFEDTIPVPSSSTGSTPPLYRNGLTKSEVSPSMLSPQPDMTVKVIGTQDGRQSSPVVQARFQFKVANPSIDGDNAASFVLNNITSEAQMWYTIDGSDPTNNPTANPAVVGPITPGTKLSLVISNDITFKARAFRSNYKPSEVSSKVFSPTNFVANRISFGFENGEASSDFFASAGQKFYAPVTLSILPNQEMYSLQFNITVTNKNATTDVAPGAVGFQSMLMEFFEEQKVYRAIPPAMLAGYSEIMITNVVDGVTNVFPTNQLVFQDLLITNTLNNDNLLGIGWLARSGLDEEVPNLFDVTKQDLITYSIAKDTLFEKEGNKVVLGAYSFRVPQSAQMGDTYFIEINRPSATTDGFGAPGSDIYIEAPKQGSLGSGTINSKKTVTVGLRKYIVGDVYPFKWLNAGDFGDTNLFSADVAQVFQTSTYRLNAPVPGSDLEDAMDSCCGTGFLNGDHFQQAGTGSGANLFEGNDVSINDFMFGDGVLDVRDVFVTFRRSLDPSLNWYQRYWLNGNRVAQTTPNVFNGARPADDGLAAKSSPQADGPVASPFINFSIGDITGAPGQTVSVPVHAQVIGSYPLRVLQINVMVEAMDGSPAITNTIQFTPAGGLGQPTFVMSSGPNNYSAAWLNNAIAGLSGTATIGTLHVKIPANANAASAYRAHFEHVSASPNGLAKFDHNAQDGLVLLANREGSSWGDDIPDSWRLRHFGTLGNVLSHADADADGDGVNNRKEYKAGTDPNDISSFLRVSDMKKQNGVVLRWPSVASKTYVIECSPALFGEEWVVISTNIHGNGKQLEFTDSTPIVGTRFYRVRLVE